MRARLGKYPKGNASRKLSIELDPFDTWSLDHTLSLIILPALIQLKNTNHGVPSEFISSVGSDMDSNYCFDFIKDDEKEVFDRGCDSWNEVMDKMIWSFEQLAIEEDYSNKYHHGTIDIGWEKTAKQIMNPLTGKMEYMYEMVDRNPNEHWYDHVGHQLHEERIQEGLDLFAKYFRNLWD